MRVLSLTLEDIGGDEVRYPDTVTVRMTTQEAAFITRVVGKHNDAAANEVMNHGVELCSEIYLELTGNFFNRYWDDGVNDV